MSRLLAPAAKQRLAAHRFVATQQDSAAKARFVDHPVPFGVAGSLTPCVTGARAHGQIAANGTSSVSSRPLPPAQTTRITTLAVEG